MTEQEEFEFRHRLEKERTTQAAEVGGWESARRGVAQGATLGLSDEITGGGEAVLDKILGSHPDKSLTELYRQHRDESRKNNDAARASHPYLYGGGELVGGVGSAVASGGLGAGIRGAAGFGALAGLGYSKADGTKGEGWRLAADTGIGGAAGGILQGVGQKVISPAMKYAGGKLGTYAGDLMERATGATRSEVEKTFQPGTGRYLLDNKLGRFLDSPGKISKRVQGALDNAESARSAALAEPPLDSVQVTPDEIRSAVSERIAKLRELGGHIPAADQAEVLGQNVITATKGQPIGLTGLEQQKSSFGGNNWFDADKDRAQKTVYGALKDLTEQKATAADPGLAGAFKEAKQTEHMLIPVREASERRAIQLNQNPMGGFLDTTSAAVGYAVGGVPGTVAAPIARKLLAPRLASSASVTTNTASQILRAISKNPATRMHVAPIQNAARQSQTALDVKHFILSQQSPEYRQTTMKEKNREGDVQ